MKYTEGKLGRIFVLKFDDKDILWEKLDWFARREKIKAGVLVFLGALRKGTLVAGPKYPVVPPLPNKLSFTGAWEAFGVGTIFSNKRGPQLHIHASIGSKKRVLTGCIRELSNVFLVVEAVVFELKGIKAAKEIDPDLGINLLRVTG